MYQVTPTPSNNYLPQREGRSISRFDVAYGYLKTLCKEFGLMECQIPQMPLEGTEMIVDAKGYTITLKRVFS